MILDLPVWADPVAHYLIEHGLTGTLRIAAISLVASSLIGIVLGTLMTIRFAPSRALIRLYVEVWRGLPIIVTLFIVYFGAPVISLRFEMDPFTAGAVTLTLWGSAQIAEATRGAVQSISRGQHDAAAALGFGWIGRHVWVILPQAARRLIPPLVSLLIGIILNTTLIGIIGGAELLEAAKRMVEVVNAPAPAGFGDRGEFQIYGFVMLIFFLICFPLTRLSAWLERRLVRT
ncbi:MAG TPA: amino acid ABC transporter permease [Gaiellaceae bacterium]|jgi:polar amino acid transport system permease protein|nr:amino acid ABC transporter permease [Gaiellaceae bacterium]